MKTFMRRFCAIFLCLALLVGLLPTLALAQDSSSAWDGTTIDVSWYDPNSTEFYISTPEQFMGLAAIVNGIYNSSITTVIGNADYIVDNVSAGEDSGGGNNQATDTYHYGSDNFAGKTIYLTADLDMGGHQSASGIWSGPNYMPIGGQYLMENNDSTTKLGASFCGTLDGQGHYINNIFCSRRCSNGNYGDGTSIGLIGRLGVHDNDPVESRADSPTVRNLAVTGYIYGNRSVGGIVGKVGKSNQGAVIENCANYATVRNTDAKGVGGIVGAGWNAGVIRNCYNAGNISSTYTCPTGGISGSNEIQIENCYNIGTISAKSDSYAMAIGTNNGGGNQVDNCYYLEDSAPGGGYYGSNKGTVTECTQAELTGKTVLAALGSAFAADTKNINGGYPILTWQLRETSDDATDEETTPSFTDVSAGAWYYDAVCFVAKNGYFEGTGNGQFTPNGSMNRAMVATVLYRMAGSPETTGTSSFSDVAQGQWYTTPIAWASSVGVVEGKGNGLYAPMASVTRQELATMLYRFVKQQSMDVSAKGDLSSFTDSNKTASWAKEALEWAVGSGIITGKDNGILDPTGTATRAEVATMLMRLAKL